ncbi:uncharacterized protein SETTUDRAFT_29675 [Exserohilum turcica Et28A]|uniref:Uncharacterized protein n=1 Tax=Exserohilum turcicum (strain 28A) TaxID=671987 RepID=R0IGQ7_EXST2|nr:uncharacterized protein SETTUDRAFT_29675 [Exserohilum turcica Et28A]EOA84430.1 hypothetical protein SETTUDRAFT_29675 [Exserohilum turcica Et28A]
MIFLPVVVLFFQTVLLGGPFRHVGMPPTLACLHPTRQNYPRLSALPFVSPA